MGFESRQGQGIYLQNAQTDCGAHRASYSMGTGGSRPEVRLSTVHLRRVPRLRTIGILPPLIRCAFMACTGTTLPLPLQARSLVTVVTELSRFCYLVLRRSMFFFITEPSAENR